MQAVDTDVDDFRRLCALGCLRHDKGVAAHSIAHSIPCQTCLHGVEAAAAGRSEACKGLTAYARVYLYIIYICVEESSVCIVQGDCIVDGVGLRAVVLYGHGGQVALAALCEAAEHRAGMWLSLPCGTHVAADG